MTDLRWLNVGGILRVEPAVVIWDDSLRLDGFRATARISLVLRRNADLWWQDVSHYDPICVLIDNDMSPSEVQGWQVVPQLLSRYPFLPVLTISDNPAAVHRMKRDGALELGKANIQCFIDVLDRRLAAIPIERLEGVRWRGILVCDVLHGIGGS